jgi:DHA1 family bicyclomycin/chloramphenicol resistance-like MFS transporter
MGLPALTELQTGLGTTAEMAGLTISLFMLGFAASPLLYGMLSDRYGRKPLLLVGLVLFALGGVLCTLAGSISGLLAARLLQGAGAGVGPTIAMAASRDRFDGVMLRRRLANLAMLRNAAPIIAPSLGAALLLLGGWRAIPVMLAVSGVLLVGIMAVGFAETLPPERRRSGSLVAELWRTARHLAGARRALGFGAVQGLAGGSLFSYVAGSPLVLIGAFKVSAAVYAGLFATTAWGIVVGAFFAGRLAHRVSAPRVLAVGGTLMLAAPLLAGLLIFLHSGGPVGPMACFVAATIGFGLTAPTASHAALEPVPEVAGTAAALLNTFQMLCMSIASMLVAILFPLTGAVAMPGVMALFAGLGLAIQGALVFRRRGNITPLP